MLLVSRSQRAALHLPLALLLIGGVAFVVGLFALVRGGGTPAAVGTLFGTGVLWLGLSELIFAHVDRGTLTVRGAVRRSELHAQQCQLGVRLKSGSRSASYVVFVTDGRASAELGEWITERGARRGAERLASALLAGLVMENDERARVAVQAVESEWKDQIATAERAAAAYYRSPVWKRTHYLVVAIVVTYVIGMAIYACLSGKRL